MSSYPLLNVFWTMFVFFLWVAWIWTLIAVFMDIFRSHDLSGPAKALWFIVVLLIPLFGVLAYLIVRGGSMHERSGRPVIRPEEDLRGYSQPTSPEPPASTADQLARLADLRDRGVISDAEFDHEKAKVLV